VPVKLTARRSAKMTLPARRRQAASEQRVSRASTRPARAEGR
jgi:hypothetical protein